MTKPRCCLVTDRRSLRPGQPDREQLRALVRQVAVAAAAGVDLVHVRERDLDAAELIDLVRACVAETSGRPTRVVVNDRADVALVAGAHGVHLRGESMHPRDVRQIAPAGFLVGRSVRHAEEAASLGASVDYVVLGTVFPTPSKPGGETLVGLDELRRAVRAAPVPVLGIGGIDASRIVEVARTGAAGFAAIRLFQEGLDDPAGYAARVARWREPFDMAELIS